MIATKSYLNLFVLFFVLFFSSCSENPKKLNEKEFRKKHSELLLKTNKKLVKNDEEITRNYINRKNWNMEMTGTGLFYEIIKKNQGKTVKQGMQAVMNYKILLLDGTLCYSSDSLGPKSFIIAQGGVESGLEEGILLMHEGEKARFIMPPHLAYGLIGDNNKIPQRATIVYEVELIQLSD